MSDDDNVTMLNNLENSMYKLSINEDIYNFLGFYHHKN
jgi:hypothetical protein